MIESLKLNAASQNRQNIRRNTSATQLQRRPSNEIFKIIEGKVSEKRLVPFENEESKRAIQRQEENLEHSKQARKVMHRHNRSSSRASNSSQKAKRTVNQMSTMIESCDDTQQVYQAAVQAIEDAAVGSMGGQRPSGEGMDIVRREQQLALN